MAGPSPNPLIGATGTAFSRAGSIYPDPFDDQASQSMPRTMPDALRWAQSINMIDGTYAQAMKRVASYFVTDVDVKPYSTQGDSKLTSEEKQKVLDFLDKTVEIRELANFAAVNLLVYGSVFVSLLVPFRRHLSCPGCGFEAPLEVIGAPNSGFQFKWSDFAFHATCPACKRKGEWHRNDRRGDVEDDLVVKCWNPHEMEILDDPLRDEQEFIWKIPEYYRQMIREGKLFHLCRANWEVVTAIKHNNHLKFGKGVIHHMRQRPLAGIYSGGWGLSAAVVNFRQAWHCQMLRRYNEAICQEFIVPFRVLSPEPKAGADPGSSDPVMGGGGGAQFRNQMQMMIRKHRRDPGQIQISPFPVAYQMLGGEANQLAPFQLIDQATDMLLNAAGVPAELYKGTLTMQAAPAALRLFESHWSPLVASLNSLLGYIVDRAGKLLNWEPVDATFKRVRTADDLNRQMALLQLMQSRQVSQTTGLGSLDIEFKQEQDQLLEEEEYVADKTQEVQEEQQAKAQQQGMVPGLTSPQPAGQPAGQPPAQGGQPAPGPAPSPSTGTSPEDLLNKADQIATQLNSMPDGQRKSELSELRKSDTTLHAVVAKRMEQQRQRQDTQAGDQARQQQQQQQAPQQPPPQPAPKQAAASPWPFPSMVGMMSHFQPS